MGRKIRKISEKKFYRLVPVGVEFDPQLDGFVVTDMSTFMRVEKAIGKKYKTIDRDGHVFLVLSDRQRLEVFNHLHAGPRTAKDNVISVIRIITIPIRWPLKIIGWAFILPLKATGFLWRVCRRGRARRDTGESTDYGESMDYSDYSGMY